MPELTLRGTKNGTGYPLTNDELDDNFLHLSGRLVEAESYYPTILSHTNSISLLNTNKQNKSDKLTTFSSYSGTGLVINLSASTFTTKSIENTDNKLTITNPTGINIGNIIINASDSLVDTTSVQTITNKTISANSNNITDLSLEMFSGVLPINRGGTNATTIENARVNLGLVIGTNVQAYNPNIVMSNIENIFSGIQKFYDDKFYIIKAGSVGNPKVRFNANALTADKILTIPNDNGTLATQEFVTTNFTTNFPISLTSSFSGSNQQKSASGFQKLPGGLIIQWGSQVINQSMHNCDISPSGDLDHTHSHTDGALTFPIPFPNACISVIPTARDSVADPIDGCEMAVGVKTRSVLGFDYRVNRVTGCNLVIEGHTYTMNVDYIAIGY